MDWGSLLTKYGVQVPSEEQFIIHCPFHEDGRQSCSINIEKGMWICFAGCGQGSLKSFIWKLSGKPWHEIRVEFESPDLGFDFETDFNNFLDDLAREIEPELTGSYIQDVKTVSSNEVWTYEIPSDHWIYKRGFQASTLITWDCQSNKYNDLIIPCKNRVGKDLGWISRRVQANPKYLYSKGFQKSKTLFGLNRLPKTVDTLIIVEGALDCMWLDQHGYTAVGILGAMMSKAQVALVSAIQPTEIILALDNDEAGRKGISKATVDLKDGFLLSYLNLPENVKDIQEIRQTNVLHELVKNRTNW
tara:strand:- start:2855 stop:3763 length:909 start_codon:yes stop_codon:yes gene_type:complete